MPACGSSRWRWTVAGSSVPEEAGVHWQAFLTALQFLTRLPVRLPGVPAAAVQGRSLLYYPLVGLLLGLLLLIPAGLFGATPSVAAALVLAVWVVVTGGLHLDGLADSADAWIGGHGDRERSLAIMKDPASGPMGVAALVLVLLLKFAALEALLDSGNHGALVLAPMLGRAGALALFLSTPYVRPGGLGQALADHLPRREAGHVLVLAGLLAVILEGGTAFVMLLAAGALGWGLRALMLRRLGGTTGDTAGVLIELVEAAALVAATF